MSCGARLPTELDSVQEGVGSRLQRLSSSGSNADRFQLVEFPNEIATDGSRAQAIVPDKWLVYSRNGEPDKCLWPPKFKTKYVTGNVEPKKTWGCYEVRLLASSSSYKTLKQKEVQVCYTTDVASDQATSVRKRRRPRYMSDQSSEPDCGCEERYQQFEVLAPDASALTDKESQSQSQPTPTLTASVSAGTLKQDLQQTAFPASTTPSLIDFPASTLASRDSQRPELSWELPPPPVDFPASTLASRDSQRPELFWELPPPPVGHRPHWKAPRLSRSDSGKQNLESSLERIERKVDRLFTLFETIRADLKNLYSVPSTANCESEHVNDLPTFPLMNTSDLEAFEENLSTTEAFRKRMVCYYMKIGGSTPQEATRRMLRHTVSDRLAAMYNMTGNGRGGKLKFSVFRNILKTIRDAVRSLYSDASDKVLQAQIGSWLLNARDRGGGREKRRQEAAQRQDGNQVQ